MTQSAAPNLGTITAQYDALGRRVSLADATGTTSFDYDLLGRITQVGAPNTGVVSYGYDGRGRASSSTIPTAGRPCRAWLLAQRAAKVVTDTVALASYTYDNMGGWATVTRAGGQETSYRLWTGLTGYVVEQRVDSAPVRHQLEYQVNRLGLRTVITETLPLTQPSTTATPTAMPDMDADCDQYQARHRQRHRPRRYDRAQRETRRQHRRRRPPCRARRHRRRPRRQHRRPTRPLKQDGRLAASHGYRDTHGHADGHRAKRDAHPHCHAHTHPHADADRDHAKPDVLLHADTH